MEVINKIYMNLLEILNTRELASIIWGLVIFLYAARSKSVRESLGSLLKTAFTGIMLKIFLLMGVYIIVMVLLISQSSLWFPALIKEVIIWIFGTGIVLIMKAGKTTDKKFFIGVLVDSIKFTVLVEFVVQLYTFNIVVELLLVPILILIVGMNVVSKYREDAQIVKKFTDYLLGAIGITYLIYSASQILSNIQQFTTYSNLASFLVPIALTILFLPFVYLLSVFAVYDELVGKHGRLRIMLERNSNKHIKYIVRKVIFLCNLNLSSWNRFNKDYANRLFTTSTKSEVDKVFNDFR